MNKPYPFAELQDKISRSQKILVILPERPFFDQVAAGLALFLSLSEAKRTTFIACPSAMTVEFNHLVGVDKISEKIYGSDLIVSFNYPADQVEKVSYNDDNGQPNVVVQVKNGAPLLNENLAKFSYAGLGADLLITVGIKNPGQLSSLEQDYASKTLINIDADPTNVQFGQINIVDTESSALCEVILGIITGLNLPLTTDIAQNVLSGIWKRTQHLFSKNVSADTYESVAICLRAGAQRPKEGLPGLARLGSTESRQVSDEAGEVRQEFPEKARFESRPQPVTLTKPIEKKPQPEELPKEQPKPPADWFEPKIFKGTSVS